MSPDREGAAKRILILDPDGRSARTIADRLVREAMSVSEAANTRELVLAMREFDPDLVLVDFRQLLSEPQLVAPLLEAHPAIPWIALTNNASAEEVAAVFRAGAHDYFEKAASFDKLRTLVLNSLAATERRRRNDESYEALLKAKDAAEAANRAKSEFLATMSHELRTPLNAIIGFSEVIMRAVLGPLGNETYLSYIKDIHASGRHLLDIINDILEFSKAEAGKLELIESEVDIPEAIVALLRLTGPRARDAGIEIVERMPIGLPRLWCDERKLKQMLLNLLSNAMKFTQSGGRIEVAARWDSDGIEIAVSDTGVGIAAENLQRVLQPFVQVENSLGRRYEGTGLGLPLVKSMAELHEGRLALESELGRGTTARLLFPPHRIGSAPQASAVGMD